MIPLASMTRRRFYGDDDQDEPMFRTVKRPDLTTSHGPPLNGSLDELESRRAMTAPFSLRFTTLPTPVSPSISPQLSPYAKLPLSSMQLDDYNVDFPLHSKTPYEVLGVSMRASQNDIKRAYKKQAVRFHPDLCRGDDADKALAKQRFQLIAEAYAILGDAARRDEYDDVRRQRKAGRGHQRPRSVTSSLSNAGSGLGECGRGPSLDDLRSIDPFYLFECIFGRLSGDAGVGEVGDELAGALSILPPQSENADSIASPFFSMSSSKMQTPINLHDISQNAHVDRHGRFRIQRSERKFHVSNNGGCSMTSRSTSFSGGTGGQTNCFLQTFMQGSMADRAMQPLSAMRPFGLPDQLDARQSGISLNRSPGRGGGLSTYDSSTPILSSVFDAPSATLLPYRQPDMSLMPSFGFSSGLSQPSTSLIPRATDDQLLVRYGHGW